MIDPRGASVKISSGKLKRKCLLFQPHEAVRPTKLRIRQAIFNTLHHRFGLEFEHLAILDAFAGSGALGFEAASLGARPVIFIEQDPCLAERIRQSLHQLRLQHAAHVITTNLLELNINRLSNQYFTNGKKVFDLIFLDPPYFQQLLPSAMDHLFEENLVSAGTILVAECHRHESEAFIREVSTRWILLHTRHYGKISIHYLRLHQASDGKDDEVAAP